MNLSEYIIEENELKELGLDKEIKIPSIKDDELALNGVSDFEEYISLDEEDNNFVPGFEDGSSYDIEDYGFDILS